MKLIILDRDGVINFDSNDYIKSPEEWMPIPGSLEAIAALNKANFRVIVATNQSGVSRGLFTEQTLAAIHAKMMAMLHTAGGHIDKIFYCPHAPIDQCNCRKPKTGLFEIIANTYQISLKSVPAIGDSLRDIHAAQAAGCKPILVKTGKGMQTLAMNPELNNILVFNNLAAAVNSILTVKHP